MSRRLAALVGAVCLLLLLGLGSAVATGHGGSGHKGAHHPGDHARSLALFADMNGRNELDAGTLQPGAGDPDGFGSASFTINGGKLCFGITVGNLDKPVAAHIHKGRKFENGPIVVPLTPPADGAAGASSGCVDIDPALGADILAHPKAYYANVHTGKFPSGAVRGQLRRLHGHGFH
jgi:CHRD domain